MSLCIQQYIMALLKFNSFPFIQRQSLLDEMLYVNALIAMARSDCHNHVFAFLFDYGPDVYPDLARSAFIGLIALDKEGQNLHTVVNKLAIVHFKLI